MARSVREIEMYPIAKWSIVERFTDLAENSDEGSGRGLLSVGSGLDFPAIRKASDRQEAV